MPQILIWSLTKYDLWCICLGAITAVTMEPVRVKFNHIIAWLKIERIIFKFWDSVRRCHHLSLTGSSENQKFWQTIHIHPPWHCQIAQWRVKTDDWYCHYCKEPHNIGEHDVTSGRKISMLLCVMVYNQGGQWYFFQRRILLWGFLHTSWYFFPSLVLN